MSTWQSLQKRKAHYSMNCTLPSGFFRLRYFHAKQLRLADYVDEQRYHIAKQRFHNEKLHGAGILCGLTLSALQADTVLLRVARGAALDDCGREIVVGFDQCVDVDSWFQNQQGKAPAHQPDPCHPDQDNKVRVCVMLRYSECPASPEPAPSSPCSPGCGCSDMGCDCPTTNSCGDERQFGRVTEEFELRLMFWEEAKRVSAHQLFPTQDALGAALETAADGVDLLSALAHPIRQQCPTADDGWLLLGCFDAQLDDDNSTHVVEIHNIDYDCASQVLLSTEVIQRILSTVYAECDANIGGPSVANIELLKKDATTYQMVLSLTAAIDPLALHPDDNFNIRVLGAAGWKLPSDKAVQAEYATTADAQHSVDGPAIYLNIDNAADFLIPGERYQLFTPDSAHPIVDTDLRSMHPRHLNWRFGLEVDTATGDLVMVRPPFAQAP